jgi:cytoskeleton protein RodZ
MQTIGERLEEARKKKGISIREAAEATKIRGDYLQKFETNHFDIGLTEIYTRGFLRTYANFLKLPGERILNDYAALGRGDVRPRQPNREVYGRMDITVATAGEASDRAAPPADGAADAPAGGQPQPRYPRGSSSLPTGPDPAVVFKYIKWGGAGAVALLVVILAWNLIGSSKPATPAPNPAPVSAPAPRGPVIGLYAVRPVKVTVLKRNADETEGEVYFSGFLAAGESRTVARPGALYVEADAPENLELEINGRRMNFGQMLAQFGPGYKRGQLPAP